LSHIGSLFVDGSITREEYTKKQQEYETKAYELSLQITEEIGQSTDLHLAVE
jgi:hypothetical protein